MKDTSAALLGFSPILVHAPVSPMPAPGRAEAWGQVALRMGEGESSQGHAAKLVPWRRLVAVRRLRLRAAGDPEQALGAVGKGIRVDWVVDPESAQRLRTVAPSRWRRQGVVPWAVPAALAAQELVETVRLAGIAGWPVALPPSAELLSGDSPLLDILDFYLFHPGLSVPVEPLHGLLVGLLARRPRTLWEHWFGLALECFFVDDQRRVSLCAPWTATRCYGTWDDPPEAWRASEPYAQLRAFVRGEAWPDPACVACEARGACGGALLALLPQARCDILREVMARLRLAAAALQRRVRVSG